MRAVAEDSMSVDPKLEAALGLHRFGFGPVRDQIAAIAEDPRGAVLADLDRPGAGLVAAANLPGSGEASREFSDFRAAQQAKVKLADRAQKLADADNSSSNVDCRKLQTGAPCAAPPAQNDTMNQAPQPPQPPQLPQQLIQNEAKVRFDAAIGADIGFAERLVWFWSNHFCVSADKIPSMVGPYEREAIRPHVLGRFADLVQTAESHPAMLFFLDNFQSMGADSIAGINRDKGLNENLAREILELHTLGVRSGYTQADVTSFANVLTGWTFIDPGVPLHGGEFVFMPRFHEPGEQTVLGKRYPDSGLAQGRAVLDDLAHHPATAQHIAQKLARHFVADEPPPTLVAKLEQKFKDTDGNLKEVAKALVTADESWTPQRQKLKPPSMWLASMLRLAGVQPDNAIGRVMGAQAALGEALWRPPAPNGYPDTEAAWIDGLPHRLDIANEFATRAAAATDPLALLDSSLGPLASRDTRDTIARAESRAQALTLLVMTPEFMRS
jgi:uncharacterized protein (DUF1800 family)